MHVNPHHTSYQPQIGKFKLQYYANAKPDGEVMVNQLTNDTNAR